MKGFRFLILKLLRFEISSVAGSSLVGFVRVGEALFTVLLLWFRFGRGVVLVYRRVRRRERLRYFKDGMVCF